MNILEVWQAVTLIGGPAMLHDANPTTAAAARQGWHPTIRYRMVAIVKSDSPLVTDQLEHAFEVTNSVHAHWWGCDDPAVTPCFQVAVRGARSTSVGDLIKTQNGDWYLVAPVGFLPLPTAV